MKRRSHEHRVHLSDELIQRELIKQATIPQGKRQELLFADLLRPGLKARLTLKGAFIFYVRAKWRVPGEPTPKDLRLDFPGTFKLGEYGVAEARSQFHEYAEARGRGLLPPAAMETVREYGVGSNANTPRAALEAYKALIVANEKNPTYASEFHGLKERLSRCTRLLKDSLDRRFTDSTPAMMAKPMIARYNAGLMAGGKGAKGVFNELTHLRKVLARNGEAKGFPKDFEDYMKGPELRAIIKCTRPPMQTKSLFRAPPENFRKAWDFCYERVANGRYAIQLAPFMMGGRQREIVAMRGDWIKEVDGDRFCHFPGWVMKGRDKYNPAVADKNSNWVYLSSRMWKLILDHRAAAGVALDDGPIWLGKGQSIEAPKQPLKLESKGDRLTYLSIMHASGLPIWGQRITRHTFATVVRRLGGMAPDEALKMAADALESALNHRSQREAGEFAEVTDTNYFDSDEAAEDQRKHSRNAVLMVEKWLAEMLGETGPNVVSLDGTSGGARRGR